MSLAAVKAKRPGTTIYHKKISGLHQKKTKSFVKAYWPYLPLMSFAIAGIAIMGGDVLGTQGAIFGGVGATVASILIII
jgi:hypothetical protein